METVDEDEIDNADDVPMGRDSYEVAPAKLNIYEDKVPMVSCVVQTFQKQRSDKPFVVLLDSGSGVSWWNSKSLPKGCVPKVGDAIHSATLAGKMTSNRTVKLEHINFPEFFKTRVIDEFECRVFEADCRYDAIIGRDLMAQIGMILDFKDQKVTWDGVSVDMKKWINPSWTKTKDGSLIKEPSLAEQLFWDALEEDLLDDDTYPTCDMTDDGSLDDGFGPEDGNEHADCSFDEDDTPRVEEVYNEDGTIKESKYESADIDKIVRGCT